MLTHLLTFADILITKILISKFARSSLLNHVKNEIVTPKHNSRRFFVNFLINLLAEDTKKCCCNLQNNKIIKSKIKISFKFAL